MCFLMFECQQQLVSILLITISLPYRKVRFRAHASGSILALFLLRSDPYESHVDTTNTDPIYSSADMKGDFLTAYRKALYLLMKTSLVSHLHLFWIRSLTQDPSRSDPNWYGFSISSKLLRIAEPNWIG